MANYQNLMAAISAVIKTNNRREITGQILQNVLNEMVGSLGENMQLTGFANPLTNPGTPDQNIFYFATQAGIYHHFDDIELDDGFSVLMWKNGQWTANTLEIAVTRQWVQNNFVSIEFFRKMFRAYTSGGAEVVPNNMQGVIDNIKAMCGMWTEQYLSALGLDHGGGGGLGARYLTDLLDVTITDVQNGQALIYNSTLQQWVNGTAGVDMATVWSNLAGATSEQVNISHLTGALSGYATTESLTQQINSTKTWVTSNFITIAYFDRLFRAYNNSTLVSHNDTTSTIDNIKAMFGFWTDFYLSALGTGGVSSVGIGLSQLNDVTLTSLTGGQTLVYDATSNKWVNGTIQTGVSTLSSLTDVLLTSPTANQVLIWDTTSSKWVNSSLKTVNGYSILGSGDIPASGGTTGNYLPLAGGTMTGDILMDNVAIRDGNSNWIVGKSDNGNGTVSVGSTNLTQTVSLNNYYSNISVLPSGTIEANTSNNGEFYVKINNTVTSLYVFNKEWFGPSSESAGIFDLGRSDYRWKVLYSTYGDFKGGYANILSLRRSADVGGAFIDFYSNNQTTNLWRVGSSSSYHYIMEYNGSEKFVFLNSASLGIGATPSYALHVSGSIYATGAVTALSDIRHKTVIRDAAVSVEDIARMPAVMYQWNDGREDKELHVGSIAQNWQTVLPEVVLKANDEEGTLSMQYGVAALVSSIIIARKVVNHEERIKQLEKEIEILKNENRKLTA